MGPHFAGGDAGKCDDEMRPRGEERHPWVSQGAATTLGYWGQFSRGPFDTLARAGHCPPQAARWASPPIPPPLVGVVPEAGTPVHSACPTGQPLAARDILGWQMPLLSEAACTWALEMATVPSAAEVAFSTRDSCPCWGPAFSPGHAGAGGSRGSLGSAASSASHSAGRVLRPWPARQGARPPPRVVAPQAVTHVLSAAVRGVGFTRGGHPVGSVSL